MNKILTLYDVKGRYFQELENIIGKSTPDELQDLSNRIHGGISQQGCGIWQSEKCSFSHCEDENCQMLSELLTLWALLPKGRPEFSSLIFDGQSQQHQQRQIANIYFQNLLERSLCSEKMESIYEAYARLLEENKHWSNIEELSELIEQSNP
ncbi:hypothetical protein VXS05_18585 [Photobacterium toruni]|uniref:hypothetical protein n=1 Tax=Photobacterium toruni TaxID=1935446 RepID=UPI002E17EA3D|nr:hypothetical protein [Photobacterium toruni]